MRHPTLESLRERVRGVQLRRRRQQWFLGSAVTLGWCVAALALAAWALVLFPHVAGLASALLLVVLGVLVYRVNRQARHARAERESDTAVAHYMEERLPDLDLALLTSVETGERAAEPGGLVEALWRETSSRIAGSPMEGETRRLGLRREEFWPLAVLLLALLAFAASTLHDPFARAAHALLTPWSGVADGAIPPGEFRVEPGDVRLERGGAVTILARLGGTAPARMLLHLQTDRRNWTQVSMLREGAGGEWSYYLSDVQADVRYFVKSGDLASRQYRIETFELPRVEQFEAELVYPPYTGLVPRNLLAPWQVSAPEGTRIALRLHLNAPVTGGEVRYVTTGEDGSREAIVPLRVDGALASAEFVPVEDGEIVVSLLDAAGERNPDAGRLRVDFVPDQPPRIALREPGRDQEVMPLDEVWIAAEANDDYGLTDFALHYGVVGRDEVQVDYATARGVRGRRGETLVYLEDLAVAPGDFVSYYFTAGDNRPDNLAGNSISDIYFLEVVPTSAEFRRAEGGARMGGQAGAGSSAVVRTQKEIIAATWKLRNRSPGADREQHERDAGTIEDSQQRVMERTLMSLQRLLERESGPDESYDRAVEHMGQAASHMHEALEQLRQREIALALRPEQAALQALLKAEATSREREVTARSGGRGGGGGGREGEELRELFDMELGELQNRYETPNAPASEGGMDRAAIDALQELARRQESLGQAQRRLARREREASEEERRRELERLQREQDELTRDTRSLARDLANRGTQADGDPQARTAEELERIARQMESSARRMATDGDAALTAAGSRKIGEQLRRQANRLERERTNRDDSAPARLRERGGELREREEAILAAVERLARAQGLEDVRVDPEQRAEAERIVREKESLRRSLSEVDQELLRLAGAADGTDADSAETAAGVRRFLADEELNQRIDTGVRLLQQGLVNVTFEIEREVAVAIRGLAEQLQGFDQGGGEADELALDEAAADAARLLRALEEARAGGVNDAADDRVRERFAEGREAARRLAAREGYGRRWRAEARRISRVLDSVELAEFLSRAELQRQLLDPAVELARALQGEAERARIRQKLVAIGEEGVPPAYEKLVEEYYRTLSETPREQPASR